jgi:O-antigen ligase
MRILLSSIYPYAFLLLYLTIPFDDYVRALPNILLVVLLAAFPFVVRKSDFVKLKKAPTLLFGLFLVYIAVNSWLTGTFETDFNIIKKLFLTGALVLLYIPVNDFQKVNRAIVYSSIAAILFSAVNIVIYVNTGGSLEFGSSPSFIEALLIDRIYLGFLCVLSILISYASLTDNFHPKNRYHVASIMVNVVFVFFIVSKITILLLIVLLLLRQMYGAQIKRRLAITLGSLIIFAVAIVFVKFKTDDTVEDSTFVNTANALVVESLTWELRQVVWECAERLARDENLPWSGYGFQNTKKKLINCYSQTIEISEKREQFISNRYNTHNQFIDFYLSSGFLGVALFTLIIGWLALLNYKSFFYTALLVTLVGYCLIENIFHRQMGAYYAGFVLLVLLTQGAHPKNKIVKTELK